MSFTCIVPIIDYYIFFFLTLGLIPVYFSYTENILQPLFLVVRRKEELCIIKNKQDEGYPATTIILFQKRYRKGGTNYAPQNIIC